MVTYMTWSQLKFGKHEGKSLPQIILRDPDWFFWAVGNGIFRAGIDDEAAEIARKSCHIKIPKPHPENWRIEYKFTYDDKSAGFSIIDEKSAAYPSENSKISTHLDLSLPRRMNKYDKFGNQLILKNFRDYYFDGASITKDRAERFFYDDRNFLVD